MNRSEIEKIELALLSRVDELEHEESPYKEEKLAEIRISAARIAKNLGLDEVKFLKRCGFKFDKKPKVLA